MEPPINASFLFWEEVFIFMLQFCCIMKFKLLLFVLLAGGVMDAAAQKIDVEQLKGMHARSLGPAGMSGRVTSIDVVNNEPDIIYVGTASGGLWKSESGGTRWQPLFDAQPIQSIGAVAIDQSNPDVVWAGTGEGNPRNSHTSGAGIYKSLDGGRTWTCMGLEATKTIHRIIIHRDNPNIVYVAALGSAWGSNPERGVYQTTDGGASWKKVLYINDKTGCADLVVDPTNPNKLFAAMWQYGRKPWFFTSGGEGSGLYVTHDGGKTWTQRTEKNGLPKGELGRIGLAVCASNPKVVYALVESKKTALYRSNDGGVSWHQTANKNIGNRPFYYADIYVDPNNENRLYNLYSLVSKSDDGGKTFQVILPYSGVHPDHHAFWVHPDDSNYLIDGNDGGLNISRDGGKTWRFVENLPLAQFYHINIDMDMPYNVYGGMQDNGSWRGPAYTWRHGGIRNGQWHEVLFGDGFDVLPNKKDNRYGYAMYQGGNVSTYDLLTGRTEYIQPLHPDGLPLRFNWNAAIAQDPFSDCGLYFGSQFVHQSNDCGKSWKIISPDLTTNDTAKQQQAKSGGLTIDATRAENFTSILVIAPSPKDQQVIWVGTDDGNVQLTRDGGASWTNLIDGIKGAPKGAWIPQIEPSPHHAGEAYVVLNDYRRNDWKPYVFKTTDYGKKWTRIANENNVSGHALSIVQDPVEPKLLFLGTENGLYFSIDGGTNWNKWKKEFPSVSTTDLKIHPREHDLIIGTFGRAAWVLDDIRPLRALAKEGAGILDQEFKVFDTPDAVLASYKPAQGVRFTADAHFSGQNRGYGAMISCWVKNPGGSDAEKATEKADDKKEAKKKEQGDSKKIKVQVFSLAGDTLRTFTAKPDTGLNRIYWSLNRTGVRFPSYNDPQPDADEPGGPSVHPGQYKIVLSFQGNKDSTTINVLADPRRPSNKEDLKAQDAMIYAHMKTVTAATEAFNRLKAAKKTVAAINKQMEHADKEVQKALKKEGKAITDSLNTIMALFMTPQDFEGYDHVTVRLNSHLYNAYSHISASGGKPGTTAAFATAIANSETKKVIDLINGFFATKWVAYRKQVEAATLPRFKDYEPVKFEE